MFRIALDPARYGLTLKIIAADSGLGYDSLRNYAAGETVMPLTAIDALCDVLPDRLLSLLFREGKQVVSIPDDIDHDAVGEWAEAYASKKLASHRADSECGVQIGPGEHQDLSATVAMFPVKAA